MPVRIGPEFVINTGNLVGPQTQPDIAGTPEGGFVVAWRSQFRPNEETGFGIEIQARAILPGQALADEFTVNTITQDQQWSPTVAARPDGSFAISYSSGEENQLPGTSVNTQYLDANGVRTGPEHLTDYDYYHWNPESASFADGSVVTVWSGEYVGEGEVRSPDGSSVRAAFDFGYEGMPGAKGLAVLSDTSFVVAWHGYRSEEEAFGGAEAAFYGQIMQKNGLGGTIFEIGEGAGGRPDPTITRLSNGNFVVVWTEGAFGEDAFNDPGADVKARLFAPDGAALGEAFTVHDQIAADQHNADIAALSDGRFVVVWQNGAEDPEGLQPLITIRAQVFDAAGGRIGEEFQVHADSPYFSIDPSVASLGGDRFAIAWNADEGQDGLDGGIKVQLFAVDEMPEGQTINGTGASETLTGGFGDDLIRAGAGADTVYGGFGDDRLWGDKGEDALYGGVGDDRLIGGWQGDSLWGELGNDILYGDLTAIAAGSRGANDRLFGGEGDDILYGDAEMILAGGTGGNDVLTGGDGDDRIYGDGAVGAGRGGNDTIDGGLGFDELWGGGGNDRFVFKGLTYADVIHDFGQEEGDNDLLDLRQTEAAFQGNLDIRYVGDDCIVDFGSGQVTLIGVTFLAPSDYLI
ncbi:calcium-binding protein [Sphingosinicella sp. LHD-64]|uniref:calcium-binding protein n=1 Tax=Sphingosinicella sp. LHD-64 TaxID=3072139 RepID=UPI00280D4295|nr:calcium-binding protein [Sphingosinicella sp. LHD-64]MDQ8756594.1 calcium-binding protein [Sphingosinicella sp. LHD-64]